MVELTSHEKLRAAKIESGLSVAELAAFAGLSKSMMGHLLTGRHRRTKQKTASRIEYALRVPIGTFFRPVLDDDTRAAS